MILYTSDHGSHFRTRNDEYKRSCHDACIHTPLIIRGGCFTGGRRETGLVSLIDLPPTLLSLAGIPIPEMYKGYDLTRPIRRERVFLQISEATNSRAIRTARYTYSVRDPAPDGAAHAASAVYTEDFLYDDAADPIQKYNLIREPAYAAVRAELRDALLAEMAAAGEPAPRILPAEA